MQGQKDCIFSAPRSFAFVKHILGVGFFLEKNREKLFTKKRKEKKHRQLRINVVLVVSFAAPLTYLHYFLFISWYVNPIALNKDLK